MKLSDFFSNIYRNRKNFSFRGFNSGFTLLFSILIISMLLSVSLGAYNLISGQIILSGVASESQASFYAALSGIECARFWELQHPGFSQSAFATSTGAGSNSIQCAGVSFNVGGWASCVNSSGASNPCTASGQNRNGISRFNLPSGNNSCAVLEVTKYFETNSSPPPAAFNRIKTISQGQNTPCGVQTSRTLQRGLQDIF